MRKALVAIVAITALLASAALMRPGALEAMPNFAQAYGVDCSKCHTVVPALNAYGRYIQRSQYSLLSSDVMKKALPGWIGYQANYDSQASAPDTHKVVWGNVAVHVDGVIDDSWSFHVQQWLVNDNQGGGLDTMWVSYNGIFKHNGNLEIGKLEVPGPSPYSQWFEIAPFALPEITIGEHAYQLDANRWGAKLGYLSNSMSVAAAYVGSDEDLNGATDWVPPNGKAWQYQLAFLKAKSPVEAGYYGAQGTFPISDGSIDRWSAGGLYLQRDPMHGVPGIFAAYQATHDSYPFAGATNPATSHGYSVDVYQPFFRDKVVLGFRREMTNDGLGNIGQYGNIDMTIVLNKYLRLYTEAGLNGANPGNGVDRIGTPAWRAFIWWTMPVAKARNS